MTWASYGISIILFASVIMEYRLKYIDKDGRTIDHKRTRRLVLGIAILSIFAQQGVTEIKDRTRSKATAVLRGKIDTANTNIAKLLIHQSELLSALSTNQAIDPKLRVEILEHSRAVELVSADISELEQWKTDFRNEQAARKQREDAGKLKHQISLAEQGAAAQGRVDRTWKRANQFYDFIVRTLQETVHGIAKGKGDKVFSDYAGLPAATIGDKPIHVASITTGTNLGWFFKVSAEAIPRRDGAEVWLRIYGSCTNHADSVLYQTMLRSAEIPGNPGTTNVTIESHLVLAPTRSDFSESINLEKYQTNVVAWVRRFIAAHAIRCDSQ
jgi:hypothetical protein